MDESADSTIALAKLLHDEVHQELISISSSVDAILNSAGLSINARDFFRKFRLEISDLTVRVRDDIYDLNDSDPLIAPLETLAPIGAQTSHSATRQNIRNSSIRKLTKAEMEILQLISTGATTAEIARSRHNSEATIKTQLTSIYRKLGVRNRVAAITFLKHQ